MLPEDLLRQATVAGYNDVMVIIGIIIAFFFIVIISKILPNRVQLLMTGVELKISKLYRCGDVIKINGIDWYLDHLNTYRITFKRVDEWKDGKITLFQDEELSVDYITFFKMAIHRLGNCRS